MWPTALQAGPGMARYTRPEAALVASMENVAVSPRYGHEALRTAACSADQLSLFEAQNVDNLYLLNLQD